MIESRMAKVPEIVARMREADTDFITAEAIAQRSDCSMPEAAVALARLGYAPKQIGPCSTDRCNVPTGPLPVIVGDRVFTVIRGGKRWTKVPEYLSNGQLTARWFVDEKAGEVRRADSWKSPKAWPLGPDDLDHPLALDIIARFDDEAA